MYQTVRLQLVYLTLTSTMGIYRQDSNMKQEEKNQKQHSIPDLAGLCAAKNIVIIIFTQAIPRGDDRGLTGKGSVVEPDVE